jgi:hypothetical protein
MYDSITLETVTLDTPNNVEVFVTDAPAKRAPTICLLSKSDKSHCPILSHRLPFSTVTNALNASSVECKHMNEDNSVL